MIPRAEMLAELMRLRYGIAIAGAHGKTTTTSMVALVLERAGMDPTAVIGGRLSAFGSNARLGGGDYMVVEADESDRSFLKLTPAIAVITNIDHEHMESYGSWDALQQAFVDFANKVPFYGTVVACVDDGPVRALVPKMTRRVVTYGLEGSGATVMARGMALEAFGSRCQILHTPGDGPTTELGTLHLRVPGRHNLMNALGAVAVGLEVGVPFAKIASGFEDFRGAERRFQLRGEARGVMVVDDYGHHPTEIAAVIAAARAGLDRRVVVVFQPHRYTRTRDLLEAFGEALAGADEIILTDIYAAGEPPIAGATAEAVEAVVRKTGRPVRLVKALDDIPAAVAAVARPNDLVITLGAGSIGSMPDRILEALEIPAPKPEAKSHERQGARREELPPREGPPRRQERGGGGRAARWLPWRIGRWGVALVVVVYAGYRGTNLVLQASGLQVRRITVHGNVRLSSGEVQAIVDGLRGSNILTVDLPGYRRRLMGSPWVADVALRRVLPSTVEVFVSERRPMGLCRLGSALYLVDPHGTLIDEFGPQYAEFDLPIIDGLVGPPGAGRPSIDEARAELAARRDRSAGGARRTSRSGSRRSTSATRTTPWCCCRTTLRCCTSARTSSSSGSSAYVDLAPALRKSVPDIDYVDLRFDERLYVRPASVKK